MRVALSVAKALGLSSVVAVTASYACDFAGIGSVRFIASIVAFVASFLLYARAWIQGYYFDKRYLRNVDLTSKVALVTGGTVGGLGFAGAEILGKMGATVIMTVRSEQKGKAAVEQLKRTAGHNRISYVLVDFSSKASVRQGAAEVIAKLERLDMLVLNAGIASRKGNADDVWMTNQVGPFLFTQLLTPLLTSTAKQHGAVRVVAVSSGAHKGASIQWNNPYGTPSQSGPFAGSYGMSKLAQIMHMRELQRRMRAADPALAGTLCICVTPGFALTNIVEAPSLAYPLLWFMSRSAYVGAQVIKMACIDEDVPGGSYLSNCYVKPTEGADGCSNNSAEWAKLWKLCEQCVEDDRYP